MQCNEREEDVGEWKRKRITTKEYGANIRKERRQGEHNIG